MYPSDPNVPAGGSGQEQVIANDLTASPPSESSASPPGPFVPSQTVSVDLTASGGASPKTPGPSLARQRRNRLARLARLHRQQQRRAGVVVPDDERLSPNDLLFVNAYMEMGRNGTEAYRRVHPGVKYESAAVSASRLLKLARIQAEIAQRLRGESGITRELVQSDLLFARDLARKQGNPELIASIAMDCAKLGGYLIEKREVKTLTDEQQVGLKRLALRSLGMAETTTPCEAN